ncbi:MAG: hypothetical protein FWB72_02470 [Firmicutes bacterium]|nr:hypothetical protein [Bacillota bacterium]
MNEQLYRELADIDRQFNSQQGIGGNNSPDTLGQNKLTYNARSDEQIRDYAKAGLTDGFLRGQEAIKTDHFNQTRDLTRLKENTQDGAAANKTAVQQMHAQRTEQAHNDALRRGLARSSIIMGKIEDFDRHKISEINNINMDTARTMANIDFELDSLNTRKQSALTNFDIQHAANLTMRINELTAERERRMQDVLKYNNTLKANEARFQADRSDRAFDQNVRMEELFHRVGATRHNQARYDAKMQAAIRFFDNMTRQDAIRAFEGDPNLRQALGPNFGRVYQHILNRR